MPMTATLHADRAQPPLASALVMNTHFHRVVSSHTTRQTEGEHTHTPPDHALKFEWDARRETLITGS
jgi:hypothetical protein